jgi:glycosyltransferase involved in cell wall biosynthesis
MSERGSSSSPLDQITPLILTYNEEANIGRSLHSLTWAKLIVVVDSFSTDRTLEILAQHSKVEVVQRAFDTHANQWNAGLDQIHGGWVLSLDADYLITSELIAELTTAVTIADQESVDGYRIPFRYCVFGKPLRGTVLPPRLALFRQVAGRYFDDGHTQALQLNGRPSELKTVILHDDRKPLSRWLWAQNRYLRLEVSKLQHTPTSELSLADRLRKRHVIAPFAVLLLCLIWQRGLLDGWRGWFYAFQRLYVEILLSLMLWEARHDQ